MVPKNSKRLNSNMAMVLKCKFCNNNQIPHGFFTVHFTVFTLAVNKQTDNRTNFIRYESH